MSGISLPPAVSGPGPALPRASPSPADGLREAAQAFEAIFVRQLLSSARAADFGGEEALLGGPGLEQFEAMRDEHFADIAAQRGTFGLADAIERQLSAQIASGTRP